MVDKILVVDDEHEIADLIEVYLKNENYEVFKFYSSKDALACAEKVKLGSNVVTDKNGVFYELDHVDGLKQITFESFIDEWVIELLENDMAEAGLK